MTSIYPDSRIVQTAYGKVQGRRLIYKGDRQVDAFQGIPFAKPPIGPLRFKKPVPPDPWKNIRRTNAWESRAIQTTIDFLERTKTTSISEDCLYLNIFTPCWKPKGKGFPIMVFIHGGGFQMGDAETYGDIGICENLVTRDIIVVTIHYRLGYLGFFTTGDDACRGNLAFWDQTEALKWIQLNIRAFGGDRDNVTIFGQSAGGASVDYLHLSPHSTGLFHKIIPMAGNAECRWSQSPVMVEQCRKKAARLGITEYKNSEEISFNETEMQLLDKLRALPAEDFAVDFMAQEKERGVEFEAAPCIDGDFLPESIDELRRKAKPKPIITGVTKEEGLMFMANMSGSQAEFDRSIKHSVPFGMDDKELIMKRLRLLYGSNVPTDEQEIARRMANVYSDYMMNTGTLELCKKSVIYQDAPVFLYVFNHLNPQNLGVLKQFIPFTDATHCSELTYLFRRSIFNMKFSFNEEDKQIEDIVTMAVTNFAKYGNPNGPDSNRTMLPSRWEPVRAPGYCNNYVIDVNPSMSEQYFDGRPSKYLEIIKNANASKI